MLKKQISVYEKVFPALFTLMTTPVSFVLFWNHFENAPPRSRVRHLDRNRNNRSRTCRNDPVYQPARYSQIILFVYFSLTN